MWIWKTTNTLRFVKNGFVASLEKHLGRKSNGKYCLFFNLRLEWDLKLIVFMLTEKTQDVPVLEKNCFQISIQEASNVQ